MLIAAVFVLAGCHEPTPDPTNGNDDAPPSTPDDGDGVGAPMSRTLAEGQQSGHEEPLRSVIRNQDDWEAFWSNHTSREMEPSEPPAVDFDAEQVIAVVLGERSNGCYHVDLALEWGEDTIDVEVTEYVPTEDMICPEVITYPFKVIATSQTADVTFTEQTVAGQPGQ
jgi:hypothetical protein